MSKLRSLPLTELANCHGLPADVQERKLEDFAKPIKGKLKSYGATKASSPEALGAVGGLFPEGVAKATEQQLRELARQHAKGDAVNAEFNWTTILALHRWGLTLSRAIHYDIPAVAVYRDRRIAIAIDAVPVINGRGHLITLDPRRGQYRLTPSGVFVLQSLMHHQLREQYPQFQEFEVSVLQFPESSDIYRPAEREGSKPVYHRGVVLVSLGDREPMPFAELAAGVAQTLSIYDAIVARRGTRRGDEPEAPLPLFGSGG